MPQRDPAAALALSLTLGSMLGSVGMGCSLDFDELVTRDGGTTDGGTTDGDTTDGGTTAGPVVEIALGALHGCAARESGVVVCWGDNAGSQLGVPGLVSPPTLAEVPGVTDAAGPIAAGEAHSCAVMGDQTVWCWGSNTHGQSGGRAAGPGVRAPGQVDGVTAVTEVAAGENHTCVVADGAVLCWGENGGGQTGAPAGGGDVLDPNPVPGVDTAVELAASQGHTCARLTSGSIRCWGENNDGEMGIGTYSDDSPPVTVDMIGDAQKIVAGSEHTCALRSDATVWCWGNGGWGQLGAGNNDDRNVPQQVPGISGATDLAAGAFHTCAVVGDGDVVCWGLNDTGQLGDGSTLYRLRAEMTAVSARDAEQVVAGGSNDASHTCAILRTGDVQCWGHRGFGQLGDGAITVRGEPAAVGSIAADAVAAGGASSCAIDGALLCWGLNSHSQLGIDDRSPQAVPITPTPFMSDPPRAVAAGNRHSCAIASDGLLWCWGANFVGQLGTGDTTPETVPVRASGSLSWDTVSVGETHSCGVSSGQGYCWGENTRGALGLGDTANRFVPTAIPPLTDVQTIRGGHQYSCALLSGGEVSCWGVNWFGRLGLGSAPDAIVESPGTIPGLRARALAVGFNHVCAVSEPDGGVSCWGNNSAGQVDPRSTLQRDTPNPVTGLPEIAQLAVGREHTCAVDTTGQVHCWGNNGRAQLGREPSLSHEIGLVDGLTGVRAIAAGFDHTCVGLGSEPARCWGMAAHGRLGDGDAAFLSTPVEATVLR